MIRVIQRDEPASFANAVSRPGTKFLARVPTPKKGQWRNREYWRAAIGEMRTAYKGICAYTCHWIPPDTGFSSVDHFESRDGNPSRAYDWTNLRLVCGRLNGRKAHYDDVIDPFLVENSWFALDFPSMLLKPREGLTDTVEKSVLSTIQRLKLNDDDTCVQARLTWVLDFCNDPGLPFPLLRKYAPFIARELVRQDLLPTIREVMLGHEAD